MTNIQAESPVSNDIVHVTGKVLPVGNGAVGNTSTAKMLLAYRPNRTDYSELIRSISRTNNLEFEIFTNVSSPSPLLVVRNDIFRVIPNPHGEESLKPRLAYIS